MIYVFFISFLILSFERNYQKLLNSHFTTIYDVQTLGGINNLAA